MTCSFHLAHCWEHPAARSYWRCTTCGICSYRRVAEVPLPRPGPCRPGRIQERFTAATALGHDIGATQIKGIMTYFWKKCGAHGSNQ